jgi:anti-sigma B factor antagonist/stage II sporulation protein AA (anti-sigma F factor antagonist)
MNLAEVSVEARDAGPVVHVRGEIDLSNSDAVRAEIVKAVPRDARGVVLDLTETTYLDSTGVRLLFDLADRLQSRRQRLVLVVRERALVRRVLVLTKLDDAVPMHDEIDAALQMLEA